MQAAFDADLRTYKALEKSWAMSVVVKGHSVYISSSLAGGGSLLYKPNANTNDRNQKYIPGNINQAADAGVLEWALMQCQVSSTNGAGHRTGANCGEMIAALAFVRTDSTGLLDDSPVVTWGRYKALNNQGRPTGPWIFGVMDPCRTAQGLGRAPVYGCAQVSGESCTVPFLPHSLEELLLTVHPSIAKLGMRAVLSGTAAQDTVLSHNPTVTYPCFN